MSIVTAVQHNPKIRAMHQRLVVAGKYKKLALTTRMRKMIVILNAMIKYQTNWSEKYALQVDRGSQSLVR